MPNDTPEVAAVENDDAEEVTKGLLEADDLNKGPDWTGNGGGLEACGIEEKGFTLSCCWVSLVVVSWKGFLALTLVFDCPPYVDTFDDPGSFFPNRIAIPISTITATSPIYIGDTSGLAEP